MGRGQIAALAPSHIVISTGPCTPNEAGVSMPLIHRFAGHIPILFAAIALAAHALSPANPQVAQGAQVFFIARLVYIPVYYLGLKFVRTTVWTISLVGLGMMLAAVL